MALTESLIYKLPKPLNPKPKSLNQALNHLSQTEVLCVHQALPLVGFAGIAWALDVSRF